MGTRGSALALAQTGLIADAIERTGARVEIITISTPGDRSAQPIEQIGVGVFTSAVRDALADGTVDVAHRAGSPGVAGRRAAEGRSSGRADRQGRAHPG